jgi:hypothetical protein
MKNSLSVVLLVLGLSLQPATAADTPSHRPAPMMPAIDGEWWQVAGNPDIGEYTTEKQQPVDFCVWQAADGTWQLWSCIRHTKYPGRTRLFHGWEGKKITDANWKPAGIKMTSKPELGETEGGMQAPHVVMKDGVYHMLYGDWDHICLATSKDGKTFERQIRPNGKTGMFTEGIGGNTRDVCALLVGDKWHAYYTAFPNKQGVDFCRTSTNLRDWSESTAVAFGGRAGTGGGSAECPFVVKHGDHYYLFRTQNYRGTNGETPRTCVYASKDPMNFGINQDRLYFVAELPIAAPEIVTHNGQEYIAALMPDIKGIRIAKLKWMPRN